MRLFRCARVCVIAGFNVETVEYKNISFTVSRSPVAHTSRALAHPKVLYTCGSHHQLIFVR